MKHESIFGKNVTICGKAINSATHAISAMTNGQTPFNIVSVGISPATPFTIKAFIPTGAGADRLPPVISNLLITGQSSTAD